MKVIIFSKNNNRKQNLRIKNSVLIDKIFVSEFFNILYDKYDCKSSILNRFIALCSYMKQCICIKIITKLSSIINLSLLD